MRWSEFAAFDLPFLYVIALAVASGFLGMAGSIVCRLSPFTAMFAGGVLAWFGISFCGYEPLGNIHWVAASGYIALRAAVVVDPFYN
jgi:hypothetical protein